MWILMHEKAHVNKKSGIFKWISPISLSAGLLQAPTLTSGGSNCLALDKDTDATAFPRSGEPLLSDEAALPWKPWEYSLVFTLRYNRDVITAT